MSERKFSRSFDMPTVDPDKEDESEYSGRGNKIAANYKKPEKYDTIFLDKDGKIPVFVSPNQEHAFAWENEDGGITYFDVNGKVIEKKTAKEILEDRSRAHVCKHEWEMYTGLSEQFEYCTICDEKRK